MEHFTSIFTPIISGEILSFVDDLASRCSMRIRIILENRSEINDFKRSKAISLYGLLLELFCGALAIFLELLFPLIRKF